MPFLQIYAIVESDSICARTCKNGQKLHMYKNDKTGNWGIEKAVLETSTAC